MWALAEAKAGMLQQAEALAGALGTAWQTRIIQRQPWLDCLPQFCWRGAGILHRHGLAPPWPRVVVSSGRYAARLALALKRERPDIALCQIQDPRSLRAHFDVIVTPRHDRTPGGNVIHTLGSLHDITAERLAQAAKHWRDRLAPDSKPLLAVLLGGPTRHCRWPRPAFFALLEQLARLQQEQGFRLCVSTSRRTPAALVTAAQGALGRRCALFWSGGPGENPYHGMLALASAVLVSADSVNMLSEACASEHPIYTWGEVRPGSRLARFHAAMTTAGHLRPWGDALETRPRPRLLELATVAAQVRHRLGLPA